VKYLAAWPPPVKDGQTVIADNILLLNANHMIALQCILISERRQRGRICLHFPFDVPRHALMCIDATLCERMTSKRTQRRCSGLCFARREPKMLGMDGGPILSDRSGRRVWMS
jgi:hypothetical protein